jgi:SAM-dependent methyltransferase
VRDRRPPAIDERTRRLEAEIAGHAPARVSPPLPAIHDFWVKRYLTPKLRACGLPSLEALVLDAVVAACGRAAGERAVVSLGAGACDAEVLLASHLLDRGVTNFVLTCVDPNPHLLARGRQLAHRHGVLSRLRFALVEPGSWDPRPGTAVYLARDTLHRVPELERLLERLIASLAADGLLLACEPIGRNRHRLWPETLAFVEAVWQALPARCRFDHTLGRRDDRFVNRERARQAGDGARAQDVLPLLLERLHFELFVAAGGIVDPFIDRAFGANFDPHREPERGFVDELALLDEAAIDAGLVKPTRMIAVLRRLPVESRRFFRHRSPEFCVRYPGLEGEDPPALAARGRPAAEAALAIRDELLAPVLRAAAALGEAREGKAASR